MLEYVFFDPRTRRQFVDFVERRGLVVQQGEDDESYGVAIPEDIDDALLEAIEARYDELMALDQSRFEADAVAAGNGETSQRIVDVLLGALHLAAASQGTSASTASTTRRAISDRVIIVYPRVQSDNGPRQE